MKKTNIINMLLFLIGLFLVSERASSLTYPLPRNGDIVGTVTTSIVYRGESLGDVGRRFDVGVCEMIEANPNLDVWVPTPGAAVIIPTQFILPKGPRVGIVLNLAEMRLYYFHPDKRQVTTHPIGLGKKGWSTPLGKTVIIDKKKDPAWHPPDSIRREHLAKGDILPSVVPGGPANPLGRYAFYLATSLARKGSFLIHGSNRVGGVGVRSSHGCIRLLPADIEHLFYLIPIGTSVRIIHEPYKVGWHNNHLYLEAHKPLTEGQYASSKSRSRLNTLIRQAVENAKGLTVNWTSAIMAAESPNGCPIRID